MRAAAERIADYGVDALASHALGRVRAQRLESLAADPDAPPFFGRTDRDATTARPARGLPHRPPARPRRRRRPGRRSTGARRSRAAFYRATPGRPHGRAAAPPVRFPRRRAQLFRGRAPRPRRGAGPRVRPAARGDRTSPRRADARHRRHHPARPGRVRARRSGHLAVHPGRAGHRQDRGRAAPGRLPALHVSRTGCAARACWWSARTAPSCTTSRRCCRRSARAGSSRRTVGELVARGRRGSPSRRTSRRSRATPGWPRCCAARSSSHVAQAGRGRRRDRRHQAATASARTTCAATSTTRAASSARAALVARAGTAAHPGGRGRPAPARGRRRRAERRRDRADRPHPAVRELVDAVWPPLSRPRCSPGSTTTPSSWPAARARS